MHINQAMAKGYCTAGSSAGTSDGCGGTTGAGGNIECSTAATIARPYTGCFGGSTGTWPKSCHGDGIKDDIHYKYQCKTNQTNPCTVGIWNHATTSCEPDIPLGQPKPNNPNSTDCVNNPILFGTGSKFQQETDFSSSTASLAITRQYYSLAGKGQWEWSSVANRLYLYNQGAAKKYALTPIAYNTSGYALAYLVRSGGIQLEFKYLGNNVWQTSGLPNVSLAERLNAAQQVEYVITNESGAQEVYNQSGALIETISINGRRQLYTTITNIDALPDIDQLTITDVTSGQAVSYVYNDSGKIVQAIDPSSQTYTYVYTGDNLTSVTFPDNSNVTYHYENVTFPKALTGITDELNKRYTSWGYDSSGRANDSRHGVNDINGPYEHGSLSYTIANGDVTLAAHTNALGKVTKYHLSKINGRNLVTKVEGVPSISCLAADSYYSYDTNGYRKTVTDKNGNVIETLRNSRGLIQEKRTGLQWASGINSTLAETAASQKTVTIWHATLALPLERTDYGWNGSVYVPYKKEVTTYTTENRILTFTVTDLTAITVPYATNGRTHVWTYSYTYSDAAKTKLQQQTVNGPRTDVSDITTYNYDALGNLSGTVNALSHTTTFTGYNVRGQVGNITDANNNVTTMTYTARGWLDILTVNGTAVTDYDYYANGLLQKVTLPDGSWLTYTYNDARHLTKIENNLGESIEYTPSLLDGKWTVEKVKDSTSVIVRQRQRVFDELGRVMTLQGQNGQAVQYGYDANDNLKTENDALQQVTSYQYDAQNRISESLDAEQNAKVDVNDQHPIIYGYDAQGNINSVTDQRGNATSYLYDGFGELIQQTSPDTGSATFTYDASGNLTGKTDARGINAAYQYDALNRLTATMHMGNPSEDISYSYDSTVNGNKGIGRLTGYVDTNGATQLTYDAWGLSANVFCLVSLQCYGMQNIHNNAGQLTSLIYPSGNSVIYGYDSLVRVNAVSYQQTGETLESIANLIEYYPFGGIKKITFANGVIMNIGNDTDGRINAMTAAGVNPLYSKTYGHTVTDNIGSIADLENSLNTRTYTYDKLSRLTTASKGAVNPITTSYSYDEVGNRLTKQVADSNNTLSVDETLSYPITSNRLSAVTDAVNGITKTYTYDSVGNITLQAKNIGNNMAFTYNNGNRMSVSNVVNGSTTSYVYNALGQRIIKIPDGDFSKASYYYYGSAGQLLAEHNMASTLLLVENVYVNGVMLVQMDARDGDIDNDGWTDQDEEACNTDMYSNLSVPVDADADSQCDVTDVDDDNDGFLDVADNCPFVANILQIDSDSDGKGDECDAFPNDTLQF